MPKKILSHGAEAIIIKSDNLVIKNRIKKSYRIPELDEKIRSRRTRSETKLLTKASKIINCPIPLTSNKTSAMQKIDSLTVNKKFVSEDEQQIRGEGPGRSELQTFQIKMPFINGKKLSDYLDKFPLKKQKQICKQIGESVAKLHNSDIIHGDLTTSNMILVENQKNLPAHSHSQINQDSINEKYRPNPITQKSSSSLTTSTNSSDSEQIFFIDFGLGFISSKFEDKAVDLHLLKQALEAKHFKNWEILFKKILEGYRKSRDAKIVLERLKAVEKRGRYKR